MPDIQCFMVELAGEGFRNAETGELYPTHRDLPAGAMYFAHKDYTPRNPGPDGKWLLVITPGGEWAVDSKANNCTRKEDWTHHCWVRHGEPPMVTVDKDGDTCGCGCSIGIDGPNGGYRYHGFLRNGMLVDA